MQIRYFEKNTRILRWKSQLKIEFLSPYIPVEEKYIPSSLTRLRMSCLPNYAAHGIKRKAMRVTQLYLMIIVKLL